MPSKIRKQIYINPDQEERLKQIAAKTGESEASIIRRAIDSFTAPHQNPGNRQFYRNPKALERVLQGMRQSKLIPCPGAEVFDRESIYDR